jgi:hypothetical protein
MLAIFLFVLYNIPENTLEWSRVREKSSGSVCEADL